MPSSLLNKEEQEILYQNDIKIVPYINEEIRSHLHLRDTDKHIKVIGTKKHKKATTV